MLKLTKEQIEENKRAIREKLDRKRNVPIAEKPEKIEEPKPMEIKKDIHVHIDRNDKEIMSGLGKIQEAVENIKETEEIDIKNFSEVVDKLGSLETAISESKVEIDNKDIVKGLLKIEKKIKEPKVSDYNDLLEFIGEELTEIKKGFTFDSIEKILEEIRDKEVDTSGIKIVDDKGKPIDWKSLGKGTIEYRGGNTGMTDVQLTQLLDGLTAIKIEGNASVGDGTELVTTAGTEVQLPDVSCKRVFIQALDDNVGTIVIGGATVVAAVGARRGMALYPSQGQWFNVSNINLLYIDSTSDGDTVAFYYEN